MNERIKALAKQAGVSFLMEDDHSMVMGAKDLEKFGELIVRECIDNLAWHGEDDAVARLQWFKINKLGMRE